uniref:Uncharacterized protein n=1 Tax=Parascaris univalens TaxID=6257 RepID=A0A915CDX4_PARUN
ELKFFIFLRNANLETAYDFSKSERWLITADERRHG